MNLRRAVTEHVTEEFLAWVAAERTYSVKLFRLTCDLELALTNRWRAEECANEATLTELCLATYHRERLERWLNILDFGNDYGRPDFKSPARKRLFQEWVQRNTRHEN